LRKFTCLFCVLLVGLCGCSSTEKDWQTAKDANTVEAFEAFIASHPEEPHADSARMSIENLEYMADYGERVGSWVGGSLFRDTVEDSAYARARALDMHFLYAAYVQKFPNGSYVDSAMQRVDQYGHFFAAEDTFIPLTDLRSIYHYDDSDILWKWDADLAGSEMSNGSMFMLSDDTASPDYAIPFSFGFDGNCFGAICLGNIQIDGRFSTTREGLELKKGSRMIYPL